MTQKNTDKPTKGFIGKNRGRFIGDLQLILFFQGNKIAKNIQVWHFQVGFNCKIYEWKKCIFNEIAWQKTIRCVNQMGFYDFNLKWPKNSRNYIFGLKIELHARGDERNHGEKTKVKVFCKEEKRSEAGVKSLAILFSQPEKTRPSFFLGIYIIIIGRGSQEFRCFRSKPIDGAEWIAEVNQSLNLSFQGTLLFESNSF